MAQGYWSPELFEVSVIQVAFGKSKEPNDDYSDSMSKNAIISDTSHSSK